ncbi:MAG TPA: ClpX C4-type zinc finger protein [Chroococcales cyanobacterium]
MLLQRLDNEIRENEQELSRARSKLYARMSHPDKLMEGEDYHVDLKKGWFEGIYQDAVASCGPLQIIATYSADDCAWRWPWSESSLNPQSYGEIATFIRSDPFFQPFASQKQLQMEEGMAEELAQLIALRAGWLGAYPVPHENLILLLALKLSYAKSRSFEPGDNLWCSFCGRFPEQVKRMISSGPSVGLCSLCIESFADIIAESNGNLPEWHDIESLPSCITCDSRERRVFAEYSALCYDCIDFCRSKL